MQKRFIVCNKAEHRTAGVQIRWFKTFSVLDCDGVWNTKGKFGQEQHWDLLWINEKHTGVCDCDVSTGLKATRCGRKLVSHDVRREVIVLTCVSYLRRLLDEIFSGVTRFTFVVLLPWDSNRPEGHQTHKCEDSLQHLLDKPCNHFKALNLPEPKYHTTLNHGVPQ